MVYLSLVFLVACFYGTLANDLATVIYQTGGSIFIPRKGWIAQPETHMFNMDKKVWCRSKQLELPVSEHSMVTLNNRAVIMGGYHNAEGDGTSQSVDVFTYDPLENKFTTLSPMNNEHSNFPAVALGDRIYTISGDDNAVNSNYSRIFEIFDGQITWSMGPQLTQTRKNPAAAVTEDGEIWVMGGIDSRNRPSATTEYLNLADPQAKWERGPDLNLPRWDKAKAAAIGNDVYVCGGTGIDDMGCEKLQRASASPNKWVKFENTIKSRYNFEMLAYGGKLYAVGGYPLLGAAERSIEEYDPNKGKWEMFAGWHTDDNYLNARYTILENVPHSSMRC